MLSAERRAFSLHRQPVEKLHELVEVNRLCDVFVAARGQSLGVHEKSAIDLEELTRLMAGGRELVELQHELEQIRAEV